MQCTCDILAAFSIWIYNIIFCALYFVLHCGMQPSSLSTYFFNLSYHEESLLKINIVICTMHLLIKFIINTNAVTYIII